MVAPRPAAGSLRRGRRPPHHDQRGLRPRRHARGAPRVARGAGGRGRPPARPGAHPFPVPERDLRSGDGGRGRAGASTRHHRRRLRRSLPGGHPPLSREADEGDGPAPALPPVGPPDGGPGGGHDRRRTAGAAHLRGPARHARGSGGSGLRPRPARAPAQGRGPLRRERRVPHLRLGWPMFRRPVPVRGGEVVARDGFVFADLLPAEAA